MTNPDNNPFKDTKSKFPTHRFVSSNSRYIGPAPWNSRSTSFATQGSNTNDAPICLRDGEATEELSTMSGRYIKLLSYIVLAALALFIVLAVIALKLNLRVHWAPHWVISAACYVSQVICVLNRVFFAGSWDAKCNLIRLAHGGATSTHPNPFQILDSLWSPIAAEKNFTRPKLENFATPEAGATVISRYTTPTHNLPPIPWTEQVMSSISRSKYSVRHLGIPSPHTIFDTNTPMEKNKCWRMAGSSGHVGIRLNTSITITNITVDYFTPKQLTTIEQQSAPTNISLWALISGDYKGGISDSEDYIAVDVSRFTTHKSNRFISRALWFWNRNNDVKVGPQSAFVKLADMAYNISLPESRQSFPVRQAPPAQTPPEIYLLQIKGNGGADTTCLYSIGLYGHHSVLDD